MDDVVERLGAEMRFRGEVLHELRAIRELLELVVGSEGVDADRMAEMSAALRERSAPAEERARGRR